MTALSPRQPDGKGYRKEPGASFYAAALLKMSNVARQSNDTMICIDAGAQKRNENAQKTDGVSPFLLRKCSIYGKTARPGRDRDPEAVRQFGSVQSEHDARHDRARQHRRFQGLEGRPVVRQRLPRFL